MCLLLTATAPAARWSEPLQGQERRLGASAGWGRPVLRRRCGTRAGVGSAPRRSPCAVALASPTLVVAANEEVGFAALATFPLSAHQARTNTPRMPLMLPGPPTARCRPALSSQRPRPPLLEELRPRQGVGPRHPRCLAREAAPRPSEGSRLGVPGEQQEKLGTRQRSFRKERMREFAGDRFRSIWGRLLGALPPSSVP